MMNEHYYSEDPTCESRPAEVRFTYRGHSFVMQSDAGVFSRGELDAGTRILLSALPEKMNGDILDLGCGWGPIGISVGTVFPSCRLTFSDTNKRALSLCSQNAAACGISGTFILSDGFADISAEFDHIITNPPIRTGKQTIYRLFAESESHLHPGGDLYLVIRKQQGAPSAITYLKTLFDSVEVIEKSGGYWIIRCIKKEENA